MTKLFILLLALPLCATEWYVSPTGSSTNMGTKASPWTLVCASNNSCSNGTIAAGDTVWLRGGTYTRAQPPGMPTTTCVWDITLDGASGNEIWIRAYPGEWPRFDTVGHVYPGVSFTGLCYNGASHLRIVGIEGMSSEISRVGGAQTDRNTFTTFGGAVANVWLINSMLHDNAMSVAFFGNCIDCRLYGIGSWYDGNTNTTGTPTYGAGPNLYVQNGSSPNIRRVSQLVAFGSYVTGMQIYGTSDAVLDDVLVEDSVIFNSGMFQSAANGGWFEAPLIIGNNNAAFPLYRLDFQRNITYLNADAPRGGHQFGRAGGLRDATIRNNKLGGRGLSGTLISPTTDPITVTACDTNEFVGGSIPSYYATLCTNNTFNVARPTTGSTLTTYINAHEKGRATVIWSNWVNASSIEHDPSSYLISGDRYCIWDWQNALGATIADGTWTSGTITLQKSWESLATFVGTLHSDSASAFHTDAYFRTFLIRRCRTAVPQQTISITQPEASGTHARLKMGLRSDTLDWPTITVACTVGQTCSAVQDACYTGNMFRRWDYAASAGGATISSSTVDAVVCTASAATRAFAPSGVTGIVGRTITSP